MDKAFLAHVVNNGPGSVVSPLALPQVVRQEVLKDLPQHFRVNRHFLFKWLVLAYCKVVSVEYAENLGEEIVADEYVRLLPVVAVYWLKESAVEEGNLDIQPVVVIVLPLRGEGRIKQRLEYVVEEVFMADEMFVKELFKEILWSFSPGLEISSLVSSNSKPPFLLEEVEKYDLPQQLLGKVGSIDGF